MSGDRFLQAIENNVEETLEILSGLIAIPSTRGNEKAPARFLKPRLEPLVDSAELVLIPDSLRDDPDYSFPLDDFHYTGEANLRARIKGCRAGRSLAFNTHLDVAPATPGQSEPFKARIGGESVFGRGACDAKGQAALMWLVLKSLADLGLRPGGDLTVDFVVEEECGGNGTLLVQRQGLAADGAVILEPTDLDVVHLIRGAVWFDVKTSGVAGHSGSPGTTVSALKEAVEVMRSIERVRVETLAASREAVPQIACHPDPAPCTFGMLHAGNWPAAAPAEAVLKGVFGFLPPFHRRDIQAKLAEAVHSSRAEIRFTMLRSDPSSLPETHPLTQTLLAACRAAEIPARPAFMNASCDVWRYTEGLGIPAVVFGVGSIGTAHGKDEQVAVGDIRKAASALLRFIEKWSGLEHVS
ncbi:MAG: M20/M25/M40 family metallo-hydrolase [Acidobacteriota bacterium]|nr:M20/M25/M40 family metallo-hydrolase [Acidobacteriota bacterium]